MTIQALFRNERRNGYAGKLIFFLWKTNNEEKRTICLLDIFLTQYFKHWWWTRKRFLL